MTSPASKRPAATAGMISANGTTVTDAGGASADHSRINRYAVVRSPGTATLAPSQRRDGRVPGEHQRPATAAERPAAGQQLVLVEQPRQRRVAHLHQVEPALLGGGVGDVDVGVRDVEPGRARHQPVHQRVEHEGVVRAGREGQTQAHWPQASQRGRRGRRGGQRVTDPPRGAVARADRVGDRTELGERARRPVPPRLPPRSPPSPRPRPPAIAVADLRPRPRSRSRWRP